MVSNENHYTLDPTRSESDDGYLEPTGLGVRPIHVIPEATAGSATLYQNLRSPGSKQPPPLPPRKKPSIPQVYRHPPIDGDPMWSTGLEMTPSQNVRGLPSHPAEPPPPYTPRMVDDHPYNYIDPNYQGQNRQQRQQQPHHTWQQQPGQEQPPIQQQRNHLEQQQPPLPSRRGQQRQQQQQQQQQQWQASVGDSDDEFAEFDEHLRQRKAFTDKYCKLIKGTSPKTYLPKCKETFRDDNNRIRKVEIGSRKRGKTEKVIIIVGATGSGKTTLINGMFNYIVGVDWEEDCRFKLIEEVIKGQKANQARSQTNWITAYTIHHRTGFTVPYTLTIIDTPGFGDTSGIKRDKEITEQIRSFFTTKGSNGIDMVDAVGFVAQSSLPRLTPSQMYIFDSVMSLFGKDIADNIFMLLTFADGQKPQVLSGIKEARMPYKKHFKFNNSALYIRTNEGSDSDDEDDFNEMFWKMGVKSFKDFMTKLGKVEAKSLVLTKAVLTERNRLELTIEAIQRDIKIGLNKLEQLSKEVQVLTQHQADIDKNKNFTYQVNEEVIETEPTSPGQYTTNCIRCNMTCHEHCGIPDDEDKAGCVAMENDHCKTCSENCHWSIHKNQPYVYVIKSRKVTKTADDLKRRYEEAEGKKMSAEQLIKKCVDEFESVQLKILALTEQARKSIMKLDKIALKPNPLSTVDYIEILITSEKAEGRPGWKKRVDQLTDVKQQAEKMQQIADDGYDPFAEYRRKYEEERKQNKDGVWTTAMKFLNRGFGLQPTFTVSAARSPKNRSHGYRTFKSHATDLQEADDEGAKSSDEDEEREDENTNSSEEEGEEEDEDSEDEEEEEGKVENPEGAAYRPKNLRQKKKIRRPAQSPKKDGLLSKGLKLLGLGNKKKK